MALMLTTVHARIQPQLAQSALTCVHMKTLKERLTAAMERRPDVTQADLAKACEISRAAVTKWFNNGSAAIKAEYVFAVAELLTVDAKWLATGKGKMIRDGNAVVEPPGPYGEIPRRRIDLILMYGRLPPDVRAPIRMLIESLAAASSDRYAKWSAEMQQRADDRDAAPRPARKPVQR